MVVFWENSSYDIHTMMNFIRNWLISKKNTHLFHSANAFCNLFCILIDFLMVEMPATVEGMLQIGGVPPDGEAHVSADRKLTVADIMSVLFGGV